MTEFRRVHSRRNDWETLYRFHPSSNPKNQFEANTQKKKKFQTRHKKNSKRTLSKKLVAVTFPLAANWDCPYSISVVTSSSSSSLVKSTGLNRWAISLGANAGVESISLSSSVYTEYERGVITLTIEGYLTVDIISPTLIAIISFVCLSLLNSNSGISSTSPSLI